MVLLLLMVLLVVSDNAKILILKQITTTALANAPTYSCV